ncbi:hypothetical protein CEXT_680101 [Caerostris extrusa]|uniref:Transmembrane protein n=1 Tax=Caerostris extrusa TaxID=172846 RepID=A0AAV4VAS0_CAEEX|nr:hypothetical protein CEXT_680101 [Caerostris extrusa]
MVSGSAPKRAGVVKDAPEDFWRRTWRCLSSFRCPGNGSEVSFFPLSLPENVSVLCPLFIYFSLAPALLKLPPCSSLRGAGRIFVCRIPRLLPDERNLEPEGYCWVFEVVWSLLFLFFLFLSF